MNKYLEKRKQFCKFDNELKDKLDCHFHIDLILSEEEFHKVRSYLYKKMTHLDFTSVQCNKKTCRVILVGYTNLISAERLDNRIQVITGYKHHLEFRYYKDLGLQAWSK